MYIHLSSIEIEGIPVITPCSIKRTYLLYGVDGVLDAARSLTSGILISVDGIEGIALKIYGLALPVLSERRYREVFGMPGDVGQILIIAWSAYKENFLVGEGGKIGIKLLNRNCFAVEGNMEEIEKKLMSDITADDNSRYGYLKELRMFDL